MTRRVLILTLAMALVLFSARSFAGKGGNKGKPGGDPAPVPEGTIQFEFESLGPHTMSAGDGTDKTLFPFGNMAEPTNMLHGGEYWYASTAPEQLVAKLTDGTEVVLWAEAGAEIKARRWAKDDSFLGFRVKWTAAGTQEVLRVEVDWVNGQPVAGAVDVVLPHDPAIDVRRFDWSPEGDRVVYDDDISYNLRVRDLATGQDTVIAHPARQPSWSHDGKSIVFVWGTLYTIAPDGSNLTVLLQGSIGLMAHPKFSPDDAHIAFVQELETRIGKGKNATRTRQKEIRRIPTAGGDPVTLTDDVDDDAFRLVSWR